MCLFKKKIQYFKWTDMTLPKDTPFRMNHCHLSKGALDGYINLYLSIGFGMKKILKYKLLLSSKHSLWSIKSLSEFDESNYLRYHYSWIESHFILGGRFQNLGYSEGNYSLRTLREVGGLGFIFFFHLNFWKNKTHFLERTLWSCVEDVFVLHSVLVLNLN